jgi:hypothetical protein
MHEPDALLQNYDLTAEEREAIKGWQVRQLYDMGANPLLLLVYSMATGKDLRVCRCDESERMTEIGV